MRQYQTTEAMMKLCFIQEFACSFLQGPNLGGLFGRKSGMAEGYSYTDANKVFITLTIPSKEPPIVGAPTRNLPLTKM